MTYGQLKFRLAKAFPGVDADLIEGWIQDRYAEILGELPWSRQDTQAILTTVAPYKTGTVALTNGSPSVTLTGGTWTSGMAGRAFRVSGRDEIYEFTYTSSTTATLDRSYEGTDDTAAGYAIFQSIYPLPTDCRLLKDDAFADFSLGPLDRMSRGQMSVSFPTRSESGTPLVWAQYMDDGSTPPRMQVELYPIPDRVIGIPITYSADAAPWDTSSAPMLTWLQPAALVEGITAKIKAHLRDYAGATLHLATAKAALQNMRTSEAQAIGPAQMQLASYYTAHRSRRYSR